jgi:hypothetical protein
VATHPKLTESVCPSRIRTPTARSSASPVSHDQGGPGSVWGFVLHAGGQIVPPSSRRFESGRANRKWKPNVTVVRMVIKFALRTGRLSAERQISHSS